MLPNRQADGADSRADLRCERKQGVGSGIRLKTDVNADAKPDPRTGAKPETVTATGPNPEAMRKVVEKHVGYSLLKDLNGAVDHGARGRTCAAMCIALAPERGRPAMVACRVTGLPGKVDRAREVALLITVEV